MAALLVLLGASLAPAAQADARAVRYSTDRAGAPGADMGEFRRIVDATLNDPRGWSLGGRVSFRAVPAGGEFVVTLASPGHVAAHPGCSSHYSCRSGHRVLINSERWRAATPSYAGGPLLHAYRQMVINHEVGHALGLGHASCSGDGARAPVMQQQSKGLAGCTRNPWPLARERRAYGRRIGVATPATTASLAFGRRIGHLALGASRSDARARLGRPADAGRRDDGSRVERYAVPRLTVTYARGRVIAIAGRSRADVAAGGLGVGSTEAQVRRTLGDRCDGPAARSCVISGGDRRRGVTTLMLRGGRVVSIRVAVDAAGGPTRAPARDERAPRRCDSPHPLSATSARTQPFSADPCAWWRLPPSRRGGHTADLQPTAHR